MPLTIAQKDFIEAAISHLLDFSCDAKSLKAQALLVHEALHHTVTAAHDYYQLRQCLLKPTQNLQGLERCGSNDPTQAATVTEVQQHIMTLCCHKLRSSAYISNTNLSDLGLDHWDNLIPETQSTVIFKSESIPTQTQFMPWEFIHEIGQIGYSSLVIRENLQQIDLKIRLWLPNESYCLTINHVGDIPQDTDIAQFLSGLIPNMLEATVAYTKAFLLQRFSFEWQDVASKEQAHIDHAFSHLISNEYYLQCLLEDPRNITPLLNVSTTELRQLLDPITISLLKNNFCTIQQAKQLTHEQVMVASCYTNLIQHRKLLFHELAQLNPAQCKLMAHPVIANLIKQNKLRCEDAKNLPSVFLKILSVNFYLDYFSRHDINWSLYTSIDTQQGARLLHPRVLKLISANILSADDFMFMSDKHFDLVTQDKIYQLICANIITRHHVISTPSHYLNTINLCDELYHYLEASIVSMSDFQTTRLINIIETGFFKRLLAIYEHQPYYLCGQKDNALLWLNDLESFTSRANLQLRFIKEKVITQFLLTIKPDVQRLVPSMMLSREKKSYKLLVNCENNAYIHASPYNALYQLVQLASDISNDLQHRRHTHRRFGIFKHGDKQRDAYSLCEHILSVADIVRPEAPQRLTFHPS